LKSFQGSQTPKHPNSWGFQVAVLQFGQLTSGIVNAAQMERGHAMKQQHVLAKFNLSERCCHGGNTECLLNSFASGCKQLVGENWVGENIIC